MVQLEFDFVDPQGLEARAAIEAARTHAVRLDTIAKMIGDQNAPAGAICRLIAGGIVDVYKRMRPTGTPLFKRLFTPQQLNDRVRAYRQLQRTLIEAEAHSIRDELNMDGPKFKFVYGEIVNLFQRALRDAGVPDKLAQTILLQFGESVEANDSNLRRDLNQIGTRIVPEFNAEKIRPPLPVFRAPETSKRVS